MHAQTDQITPIGLSTAASLHYVALRQRGIAPEQAHAQVVREYQTPTGTHRPPMQELLLPAKVGGAAVGVAAVLTCLVYEFLKLIS